jgi:hypothetical protein
MFNEAHAIIYSKSGDEGGARELHRMREKTGR